MYAIHIVYYLVTSHRWIPDWNPRYELARWATCGIRSYHHSDWSKVLWLRWLGWSGRSRSCNPSRNSITSFKAKVSWIKLMQSMNPNAKNDPKYGVELLCNLDGPHLKETQRKNGKHIRKDGFNFHVWILRSVGETHTARGWMPSFWSW